MFYPMDSLRKGGRFYLCWIADSWPLRFEKFTYRNQRLWSQDIREICDYLREVITSESGRPSHRFSLRLSSQLMRGLTRLYQKKVDIFVRDVLHITTKVRSPRTSSEHAAVVRRRPTNRDRPRLVIEELPPEEVTLEQIQEMAQNNTVARVEDITLREPTLPEIRLIEDGFGELNQDPVEIMLAHEISAMQQSVLDLPFDFSTDKSHDKSRLAPHDTAQMERISEHDISVFRKSAVEAPSLTDLEKEIPEIREIPPPELPAPEPQMQVVEQPLEEAQIVQPAREQAKQTEPQEIVLEELEDEPQRKRRRPRNKLIVDKATQLSKRYILARIADNGVESRYESAEQVTIVILTPASTLLTRPAHGGRTPTRALGRPLAALFAESMANVGRTPAGDRPVEEVLFQKPAQYQVEEIIQPETSVEKTIHDKTIQDKTIQDLTIQEQDIQDQIMQDISNRDISVRNIQDTEAVARDAMDIADLPTQKLITISQEKRASENERTLKRRRSQRPSTLDLSADANKENIPGAENVPVQEYVPEIPRIVLPPNEATQLSNTENLTSMLLEAGLADAQPRPARAGFEPATLTQRERKTRGSEGSETPLGSLDRTKVSLGESEKTTDSKRFIDEQWGVQGTMKKIYDCFAQGVPRITVESLVQRGPFIESRRRIIAARCFTSILKLQTHGFIKVTKDEETYEIRHIELGPKITGKR